MKMIKKITAFVLIFSVLMVCTPNSVNAEGEGTYLLKATPFYTHPVTNEIEDPGKNPGIGQGMTESVLGEKALYEVYPDDTKYITVRFALMDNISNIKISHQNKGDTEYSDVDFEIKQQNKEENKDDFRFQVPDSDVVVRIEFFVDPMGRDVIFFATFSDPVEGSGDFVTTEYVPPADTNASDDSAGTTDDGASRNEVNMYMTLAYICAAAVIIVIIAFIGYIYYTRKIIKFLKNERNI